MSECQRDAQIAEGWPHEESAHYTHVWPRDVWTKGVVGLTDRHALEKFSVHTCGNGWKNWVFLRIESGDGYEGVGECSLNGFAKTTGACIEELSRYFLGKRPEEYATISTQMLTDLYSDAGQLHRGVIAAVEMACLDILGKRVGLPVYALLGGKVWDEVPAYANGWYRVERTPEGFRRAAERVGLLGYTVLKCDPFGPCRSPLSPADRNLAWKILHELQRDPAVGISVDAHQRLDFSDASWCMRSWPKVEWIEEPLPWWDIDGLARLANAFPTPIATGENLTSVRQFEDLVSQSGNLILQPDVMNLGGIMQALEVCRLAERHGLRVCPHDAQGPVSRACCILLAALSPAVWMLEDFDPWNVPWTQDIATTFRAERGVIGFKNMPPGLGVTIHWDKVRDHPYDPNGWVPLFEAGWEKRGE